MGGVHGRRGEHDLRVRCELDISHPRPEIRDRDAPDLGVVLRGHDHVERRADVAVSPDDLRPIL